MATWQLQDAKARLSEVVDTATTKGPQVITRRGVQTAVVVSFAEWQRVLGKQPKESKPPSRALTEEQKRKNEALLKLFRTAPDFEIPARGHLRLRKPVEF